MKRILFIPLSLMVAACSQQAVQYEASVTPYRDGKRCAISFTFDDGMLCHYTDIAPELEKRGFLGTFWIIGKNMDSNSPDYPWMTWDQVADLAHRGHEMSNHTWNHPSLPNLSADEVRQELEMCDAKLEEVTGHRPITMAYPYNAMSPEVVAICEEGRVGTRTYQTGQGQKESHTTPDSMRVWLEGLLDAGKWGVTMTHGTTYGWDLWNDPQQLYNFFDEVKEQENKVWVGTFAQVAAYRAERESAMIEVKGTRHSATIIVHHTLDKNLYTEPLTIKVRGTDWSKTSPKAQQANLNIPVNNCGDYLLLNIMPESSPIIIEW